MTKMATTPKAAIRQTIRIWVWLAEHPLAEKRDALEILGIDEGAKGPHGARCCPLCQAFRVVSLVLSQNRPGCPGCHGCPLSIPFPFLGASCGAEGEPYWTWCGTGDADKKREAALEIVKRCEAALKEAK